MTRKVTLNMLNFKLDSVIDTQNKMLSHLEKINGRLNEHDIKLEEHSVILKNHSETIKGVNVKIIAAIAFLGAVVGAVLQFVK